MASSKKTDNSASSSDPIQNDEPETVMENLYKRNIEVVTKNKTLSLLSKLYEISILTLEPKELATRISHTVQGDLSFEFVGISILDEKNDSLAPLSFSKSEKMEEAEKKANVYLENITITNLSHHNFFTQIITLKRENTTNNVQDIWGDFANHKDLENLANEATIKTILILPLLVESKILGFIIVALNRNYETLTSFEKESIESFVNVVSVALEKAYLYKELEDANAQLRELDRQKDELLGIVSHQLATPVSSMRWNLEMMLDGDLGKFKKEQEESLKSLQSIATDLSDLVSMILDVSRIQLGRIRVDKQELDLSSFFKEIMEVIEPKAKEKKVQFTKLLPKKYPKAELDKRYTRMTIENLLTNAIKYTPEKGKVQLKVELHENTLYCEVKDSGVGIPKQDQGKIFGKLFRASNVRNTVDGNGFGLYVAKGAIEAQGGKIWFESEEGKGTTFFIELPIK